MAENSKIEWTDHTFNPWRGCTAVSPACDHCYAETLSKRVGINFADRIRTSPANWKLPLKWQANAKAFFEKHGRRQRVFCASLADVFDNKVDPAWRADLFRLIRDTPDLDWLLLTKRIGNVERMVLDTSIDGHPVVRMPPNVWLGISLANQKEAERDVWKAIQTKEALKIAVLFVSYEPALGPLDLTRIDYRTTGEEGDSNRWTLNLNALSGFVATSMQSGMDCARIDWVIAGGESGPGARPGHPNWYRSMQRQCEKAGVAFLFKQWGEWRPMTLAEADRGSAVVVSDTLPAPQSPVAQPFMRHQLETMILGGEEARRAPMVKGHKGDNGRTLDGRQYDGYPAQQTEHA